MTKTYCLASAKGGSGKTVICASFAAFLAKLGYTALIVDTDNATHGLTLLYLKEVREHKETKINGDDRPSGIFETQPLSYERDVVHLSHGVDFLPATFDFSVKPNESTFDLQLLPILKDISVWARSVGYDYILLDAQAGTDICSRVAMSKDISDEVIIVTEYDPLSAAGVERLKATMREALDPMRTWVLINKMLPDFVDTFSDFLEISRYLNPIPWDADVVRAYARRALPIDLVQGNQFTLALMQTLRSLLGKEASAQLDSWAEGRASQIREPLRNQYRDAELTLETLIQRKQQLEREGRSQRWMQTTVLLNVFVMLAIFVSRQTQDSSLDDLLGVYALLFGVISLTTYLYLRNLKNRSSAKEVESARINIQIDIVTEELKRLEVLQKADLRTLVARQKR